MIRMLIWKDKRGAKADNQTLYEWLDYQNKLTVQSLASEHIVLYNGAGTNISASYLDRRTLPLPFIADHMSYWMAACSSQGEADCLVSILNSETVNEAIKPFQSVGLLGERHVHTKVLALPIPEYRNSKAAHRLLAQLGDQARVLAREVIHTDQFPTSLSQQRAFIRERLRPLINRIDQIVKELI